MSPTWILGKRPDAVETMLSFKTKTLHSFKDGNLGQEVPRAALNGQEQLDASLMEDMDPIEEADGSNMPPLPAPVQMRFRAVRAYKYGFCDVHAKALRPAVAYSGRHAGRVVCRCPHFYFLTENNGRECWLQNLYMGDPNLLPKGVVAKVKELKEDLRWNLRHGPATR